MISVNIYTLSNPPELELDGKFYNKVACYVKEFGMVDFIQIDQKGVKSGICYPADVEFISSAKKQSVKVLSLDLEKGKPFEMVVKK